MVVRKVITFGEEMFYNGWDLRYNHVSHPHFKCEWVLCYQVWIKHEPCG